MRRTIPLAASIAALSFAAPPALASPTEPGTLQNELRPSSECRTCHLFPNPAEHADEPSYAPQMWQGSMMANAARDPIFWAGVALAAQDEPSETEDCVRCHAPNAFLEERGDAIAMDELLEADLDGVTCELCHRLVHDGMSELGNAQYEVDDMDLGNGVPRRGPWSYEPESQPEHAWSDDAAFMASSQACGTCHDVTTGRERVDDEGVGMGVNFNEQRTYSEWLNSDFALPAPDGQSCQDCHMPAVADVAGCGGFSMAGNTHATGGRRHDLVGANRPMIELLQGVYGDAGTGEIDDFFFDHAIEQTDELLAGAATLEVDFPEQVDASAGIEALHVTVTNNTGHKLPTGYSEGRVMWLEFSATYGDQTLWSSGAWDGTEIEDDPQVRRYEAIAERWEDGSTLHLLRNDHWVVDNRIPPRGLTPDVETDPVGDRYELDDDQTWPNRDAFEYAFEGLMLDDQTPNDPEDDEVMLRVRLLYLINTPEYLEVLVEDNVTNDAGTHVFDLIEDAGGIEPLVLAELDATVPLRGFDEGEGTTTGGEDSTGGGDGDGDGDGDAGGESGDAAGGGDESGCNCSTRDGGSPAGLGFLVLLGLAGRRRLGSRASMH